LDYNRITDMRKLYNIVLFFALVSQLSCSANYESKDLKTFNLFGKVKSVIITRVSDDGEERISETLKFSETGDLYLDGAKIVRDSIGRISSIEYDMGGTGFKYDIDGNVIERYDWDTSTIRERPIKVDSSNNYLESEQYGEMGKEAGESPSATFTYEYSDIDNNNNWTMRRVIYKDLYDESWSSRWSEKRTIEYF